MVHPLNEYPIPAALLALMILSACSPAVRATTFVERPAPPVDHPIRVYQSTEPECPFEEVGIVSSRQRNAFISMDEVMESVREKARELGGDAVIGLSETNESRGAVPAGGGVVVDRDPVLSGTVIRFTDPDCRR